MREPRRKAAAKASSDTVDVNIETKSSDETERIAARKAASVSGILGLMGLKGSEKEPGLLDGLVLDYIPEDFGHQELNLGEVLVLLDYEGTSVVTATLRSHDLKWIVVKLCFSFQSKLKHTYCQLVLEGELLRELLAAKRENVDALTKKWKDRIDTHPIKYTGKRKQEAAS